MGAETAGLLHAHGKQGFPAAANAAVARAGVPEHASPRGSAAPTSFARIAAHAPGESLSRLPPGVTLQRKLAVGAVDDPLEREADAVADRVVRMGRTPRLANSARQPALRRACSCDGSEEKCEACKAEHEQTLQLKSSGMPSPAEAPPIVHEVLRSPGKPLDAESQSFMQPRFGYDFGNVRLHTDAQAAESARAVSARAYTVGHELVFGAGQYAPGTPSGRRLMAHELAHVVQQGNRLPATADDQIGRDFGDVHRQAEEAPASRASTRAHPCRPVP